MAVMSILRWVMVGLGSCMLAVSACSSSDESSSDAERDLRLPSSDELCALVTTADLPGDEFRFVAGSGSFTPDGRIRFDFQTTDASVTEPGFALADASCSWLGDSGDTMSMLVIDSEGGPEQFDVAIERLLPGTPVDGHPLSDHDGFDDVVVGNPASSVTIVAAEARPFVLVLNASLLSGNVNDADRLIDQLLTSWLELARR